MTVRSSADFYKRLAPVPANLPSLGARFPPISRICCGQLWPEQPLRRRVQRLRTRRRVDDAANHGQHLAPARLGPRRSGAECRRPARLPSRTSPCQRLLPSAPPPGEQASGHPKPRPASSAPASVESRSEPPQPPHRRRRNRAFPGDRCVPTIIPRRLRAGRLGSRRFPSHRLPLSPATWRVAVRHQSPGPRSVSGESLAPPRESGFHACGNRLGGSMRPSSRTRLPPAVCKPLEPQDLLVNPARHPDRNRNFHHLPGRHPGCSREPLSCAAAIEGKPLAQPERRRAHEHHDRNLPCHEA